MIVTALAIVALASARSHEPERELQRAPVAHSAAARALRDGQTIELNAAPAADLLLLPGVGPKLAARIVEERTRRGGFRTLEDLQDVRGIGPATFARLAPLLRITDRTATNPTRSP